MLTGDHAPIEVTDSTLDMETLFAVLASVARCAAETRDDLILIVPSDLGSRYDGIAFPGGTRELFHYLRERVGDQAMVEAAVRDDEYQEFEFRSVDIFLPPLYVASNVLLPLAVNLLSDWISRRLHAAGGQDQGNRVSSEVHFNSSGQLKRFKYEGPAATFETVMLEALRNEGVSCAPDRDDDDCSVE